MSKTTIVHRWYLNNALANYNHLLIEGDRAWVVDPFRVDLLEEQLIQKKVTLQGILLTHDHSDHVCGVQKLLKIYPGIPVCAHRKAAERLGYVTDILSEGDVREGWHCLETPGHIDSHLCYYHEAGKHLICGDTLFNAGVGNAYQKTGDVRQLYQSIQKLLSLPDTTRIYPSHDYFLNNLNFSSIHQLLLPMRSSDNIQAMILKLKDQTSDMRSIMTLGDEKRYNLFLQVDEPVFYDLRIKRDAW